MIIYESKHIKWFGGNLSASCTQCHFVGCCQKRSCPKKNIIDSNKNNCPDGKVFIRDILDITEYVIDSIMFIRFIVELEEELRIEIPDEVLIMDSIVSLNSFAETITNVISDYVRC